jgi:arylsulfatase
MTNIALVILDTLRYDAFEEYFEWLPGTRYSHAFSPGHYTIPAHGGMFTGRYPSEVGTHAKSESLDTTDSVLAEVLSEAGYRTRAFSSNTLLSPWNNWDRGFDQFHLGWRVRAASSQTFNWNKKLVKLSDKPKLVRYLLTLLQCITSDNKVFSSLKIGWYLKQANHDGAPEVLKFVSNTGFNDNEFLFINLMEAHLPYNPPPTYQSVKRDVDDTSEFILGGDRNCEPIRAAYDESVEYLSDMYRKIFNEIKQDFDYIITASDHGELFGEHDAIQHWYGVYPELTHVPLTIYKGKSAIDYRHEPVSLIDVYQTIVSILRLDGGEYSRGRDIRGELGQKVWLTESMGLRPERISGLESKGYSTDEISEYDIPLYGLVGDGYYGWQTVDSFTEQGKRPKEISEPLTCIENKINSLNMADNTDSNTVPASAQSQLRQLGYL